MIETAEQTPIISNSSLFRRIVDSFRSKPKQETFPVSPQTSSVLVEPATPAIQTTTPRLPRQERRRLKKEEYERWKASIAASQTQSVTAHATPAQLPATEAVAPAPAVETKTPKLPTGIKERVSFAQLLSVDRDEIPWLEREKVDVPLELMTLATTKGERFLYGSLIEGKNLNTALERMTAAEQQSIDDTLFVQLSELIQIGHASDIQIVHNHRSKKPTFETGNYDLRVYFQQFRL